MKKLTTKSLSVVIVAAGPPNKSCFSHGEYGMTLLQRQIDIFRSLIHNVDITVILGHDFDRIYSTIDGNARVIENENYANNTSAHSVVLGLRNIQTDYVYVLHGDILFSETIIQLQEKENHTFLINGQEKRGKIGLVQQDGLLYNLSYGLDNRWGQLLFLNKQGVKTYKNVYREKKIIKPYLFEVINAIVDQNVKIKCLMAEENQIREINSQKDLL